MNEQVEVKPEPRERGKAATVATLSVHTIKRAMTQVHSNADRSDASMVVFEYAKLYTPLDVKPVYRELRPQETQAFETLFQLGHVPFKPTRMVYFAAGAWFADTGDSPMGSIGIPNVDRFLDGIGFYIGDDEDTVTTAVSKRFPLGFAKMVFTYGDKTFDLHPTEGKVTSKQRTEFALLEANMMMRDKRARAEEG